jgi:hypothetical protein
VLKTPNVHKTPDGIYFEVCNDPSAFMPGVYVATVRTHDRLYTRVEASLTIKLEPRPPTQLHATWLREPTSSAPSVLMGGQLPVLSVVLTDDHGFLAAYTREEGDELLREALADVHFRCGWSEHARGPRRRAGSY